jgi:hypothetical protein
MDSILPILPEIPQTVQEVQIPVPHEFKFLSTMRKQRGQVLFVYNRLTDEITEVYIKEQAYITVGKDNKPKEKVQRRVIVEKNCVYLWALNLKNARRKVAKYILKK